MRDLTFKGFLKQYVYALSSSKTHSLYKLSDEASTNSRLREPLFLYALFHDKGAVLLQATKDLSLKSKYSDMFIKYDKDSMRKALDSSSPELPERYIRVFNSYTRLMMRKSNKTHLKTLLHKRIRKLQAEKKVSNYRLYTDLKLNPSNINSFLKTGNPRKVSQDTADRMLAYLESVA